MTQAPRAVLFDFDGIILDTEWPIYESYVDLYQKHGHELALETYVQCIGSDFQSWSPETHLEDLTDHEIEFDWPTINKERNIWIREQLATYPSLPGIPEAIAHCQSLSLKLAVVSSSSHSWVDGWLEKLDLLKHFDRTICRDDVQNIKPAPDLFLEGAKQLGVEPSECLVIEDSANGLKSATAAGMSTYIIPNRITAVSDFSSAAAVLSSAAELPTKLDELFAITN